MTGIWAKSILASEHSLTGKRIDTLLVRMPRCILAEFNTHRAFSRNAASSRAIPIDKMIAQVQYDPFIPMKWTKNQKGMQGYELLSNVEERKAHKAWLKALHTSVESAQMLNEQGAHKQIVNRILEPWMWTIVVVTATEWENFFALRNHPAAEPHMQILAQAIYKARDEAVIQSLEPGEWHLPFLSDQDKALYLIPERQVLSVARCASTSYKTVEGFDMDLERATKIYESLLSDPLHASPFEHQAQADDCNSGTWSDHRFHETPVWVKAYDYPKEHRNFIGFRQLRAQIEAGLT